MMSKNILELATDIPLENDSGRTPGALHSDLPVSTGFNVHGCRAVVGGALEPLIFNHGWFIITYL